MAWGIHTVLWRKQPFEDSLMLLRYADHFLAHGAGIARNIGDRPVEGATDFLYFLVVPIRRNQILQLRSYLCVPTAPIRVPACINRVSLLGDKKTFLCRSYPGRLSLSISLCLAPASPMSRVALAHLSYGLMAMGAWYFACRAVVAGPTASSTWAFAVIALLMALTRPDGLLLAIFMSAALLVTLGRRSFRMLAIVVAVFAIGGGAYFAWRPLATSILPAT